MLVLRNMDAETLQRMTDELMVIYSDKFSDKVPERSIEKILPLQTKCPKLKQSRTSDRRVPETACYQRGQEKNKDLGELRTRSRGYSGR